MSRTINTMPPVIQGFAKNGFAVHPEFRELAWRRTRSRSAGERERHRAQWAFAERFASVGFYGRWPHAGGARSYQGEAARRRNRSNRRLVRQLLRAGDYELAELRTYRHHHSATWDLY